MATVAAKFFLLPRVEHQSSRGNLDLTLARFWFYFVFLLNFDFFDPTFYLGGLYIEFTQMNKESSNCVQFYKCKSTSHILKNIVLETRSGDIDSSISEWSFELKRTVNILSKSLEYVRGNKNSTHIKENMLSISDYQFFL